MDIFGVLIVIAIFVLFALLIRSSLEKTVRKIGTEYRSIVKLVFFFCLSTLFLLIIIIMLAFDISSDLDTLSENAEAYNYEESYESETDEDEDCLIDGEEVEHNSEESRMFGYSNCD